MFSYCACRRIETSQYPPLVILLLRMTLDTSDHYMRDAATQTLHMLIAQLEDQDTLLVIAQDIFELIEQLSFRDRYVVLSFLPLNSEKETSLVRGLCYQLLFPKEVSDSYQRTPHMSSGLTSDL